MALKDGVAVESGTHDELMGARGLYHGLVMAQLNQDTDLDEDEKLENDDTLDDLYHGKVTKLIIETLCTTLLSFQSSNS